MGVSSYAHMLNCSLLFLCEHLFTFQLCPLMPKISKESFARFWCATGVSLQRVLSALRINRVHCILYNKYVLTACVCTSGKKSV